MMTSVFDEALKSEYVTVVERFDDCGEFIIRLGNLATLIKIRLGRGYLLSHVIKNPLQADAYFPDNRHTVSRPQQLEEALSALTAYYVSAVKAGKIPTEDWLEVNPHFVW